MEHEEHLSKVLEQLWEWGLNYKAKMCQFGVSEVGLLGFVINSEGIGVRARTPAFGHIGIRMVTIGIRCKRGFE
jgi:hypothetical protein